MASLLTLGICCERMPASVVPVADPPDLPNFDAQAELRNNINRVLERFFAEGKWQGTVVQAIITTYLNSYNNRYFTLPRTLETCIRGGQIGYKTRAVQNEWCQYLPEGRGIMDPANEYAGPIEDLGDGYCVFRDIETASVLTISSSETECAGSYVWIRGKDASGNKIYSTVDGIVVEGIRIDLSNGVATTTEVFSEVYGFEKAPTEGIVTMSDAANTIGIYEPGERVASYRRYKCDNKWENVKGMFKRRHCWAYSDNDPLYPPSLEAIKLGLMAINAEEKMDVERSQYYMDRAIQLLNAELKEYNSGQEGIMQVATWVNRRFVQII